MGTNLYQEAHSISLASFQPVPLRPLASAPGVGVLITCYNYGPYVGEAIESVLAQTYHAREIIVADDGSADSSREVIAGYAARHPFVKLIACEHGGMARSLNAAFAASTADIVCFLDADDVFLPGKLAAIVEGFKRNHRAGFLAHPAIMVDHRQRRRGIFPLGHMPFGDCSAETFRNAGILMGLPPTTNLALRREVADRIFPVSEEFTGYAEQVIHRLAPFLTEICTLREPFAEWRQHGKNDQKATHVSPERVEREIATMSLLWQRQKDYLASVNPALAHSFPPLAASALFRKLQYIRARLLNHQDAPQRHRELLAGNGLRGLESQFWRLASYLPRPLFSHVVDLLMTQSLLKEAIARFRRFAVPA